MEAKTSERMEQTANKINRLYKHNQELLTDRRKNECVLTLMRINVIIKA
jgi:hypothetical protein